MPDNGAILVVTDSGSKQKGLEKSIREKSRKKNIRIYFLFYPTCRADCADSLPVYERLSDGEMFNTSEFTSEKFFSTVITKVCNNSDGFDRNMSLQARKLGRSASYFQ